MSDKPIPPELQFLIDAERARPEAPTDARAAAQAKLAALLGPVSGLGDNGHAGAGPSSSGSSSSGAGSLRAAGPSPAASGLTATKLLAVFALGGVVGGGVATAVVRSAARDASATRATLVFSALPAASATAATAPQNLPAIASASSAARPAAPAAPPLASPPNHSRDGELAAERAIIERARSALARGDVSGALESIAEHQRAFAHGQLIEEREALAVQALAVAGRGPEAAARGARFRSAFPRSLLLPLVDQALR